MKLLLDSHIFIWLEIARSQLSDKVREVLLNQNNHLCLSLASIWEIQIKIQLGKLHLNHPLAETISIQQEVNGVEVLPITLTHILALDSLPYHHRDPFDRLLVAQSQVEGLTLVTNDSKIWMYDIPHLW